MTASIGYALGIGSGLDIKGLVDGLSAAARGPKDALFTRREQANAARVSALGEISAAIDSFASALSSLIGGGSLYSQPSVSDASLIGASALPGARLAGLSAQIEVVQLAQGQTSHSAPLAARTAPVGEGRLVLASARGSFDIAIGPGNDSLEGLARAINDAGAGVRATILTDAGGARLVLKGETGAAQAFSLSVAEGEGSGIERFASGPGGLAEALAAQDAVLRVDGVEVRRSANSMDDLLPGVRLDLKRAAPGSVVTLGVSRPTAAIEQTVRDFVEAYNEIAALLAKAAAPGAAGEAGPLRGDIGLKEMQRQLAALPSAVLATGGTGPATLAEIGVRTNRDGTLGINAGQLRDALLRDPDGVEALFNPTQRSSSPFVAIASAMGRVKPGTYRLTDLVPGADGTSASGRIDGLTMLAAGSSLVAPSGSRAVGLIVRLAAGAPADATITVDPGLGGALQAIRDSLRARSGAFAATGDRLAQEAKAIATDREAHERRAGQYYNQLLQTFTAMERQVSAAKATQSYLEQQIKVWSADRR
jgi:flagellar hook-associated protein 2